MASLSKTEAQAHRVPITLPDAQSLFLRTLNLHQSLTSKEPRLSSVEIFTSSEEEGGYQRQHSSAEKQEF